MLINNFNITDDSKTDVENYFGIITSKDGDYYKVMINNIEHNNIRSLSKVDYEVNEKVLLIYVSDVYFIIGSYDTKHGADTSDCVKKSDIIDTGWVNLSLTNNFTTYGGATPKYRQIGGLVFIRGIVTPKTSISFGSTSTKVKIANLPSSILPNYDIFNLQTISATYKYRLEISPSGLFISNPSNGALLVNSISSSAYLSINCCYCLDNVLLGMINNIIEEVSSYNNLSDKPSLNGQTLIGDTILNIPNTLSDLSTDYNHRVVTDNQINNWNNKVSSVNGKTGVINLVPSDLGLGNVFKVKGSKPTKNDLPLINNEIGDVWYIIDESVGYIWLNDGVTDRWEQLGLEVDLSKYVEKVDGKGLSTNDFSNYYMTKLDSLENYDDTDIKVDIYNMELNKQDRLIGTVSEAGQNIKSINNESLLGTGNITIDEDFVLIDSTKNVEIYESQNFMNVNFTGTYNFKGGTSWETIYTGLEFKPKRNVVCNVGSPLVNNALNRCFALISNAGNIGIGCYNARSNVSIYGNFLFNK